MGTLSLVVGLLLMAVGVYLVFRGHDWYYESGIRESDPALGLIVILVGVVPLFVTGGLLLRKYDRDMKK